MTFSRHCFLEKGERNGQYLDWNFEVKGGFYFYFLFCFVCISPCLCADGHDPVERGPW